MPICLQLAFVNTTTISTKVARLAIRTTQLQHAPTLVKVTSDAQISHVEPVTSVSLLPFSATVATTLGSGPVGPTISIASNTKAASVISFGNAPTVLTTTIYISEIYTTTIGGSASAVTSVSASTGVTTSYGSAPPTMLPPSRSTNGVQSTSTIVSSFESTEVQTVTSGGLTYPVTSVVEATKTILSCAGGCRTGGTAAATETVCIRRKQTKVFRKDEI
ncbi:MAG: hypothetical protein LQ340_000874 [Diploschistes diacapsis]|nr:MAG: hypothetical protein LQ340_000874 [Diploschistes diacapsis]